MFLYRIYQIFIMLPILAAATILCATVTILGCALGGEKWWGFRPASMWGRLWCLLAGVKVDVHTLLLLIPYSSSKQNSTDNYWT